MAGKGQAEGCAACAKWLLIIFNVLFCLLGVGMLAAGIYAYIALRDYFNFLGDSNVNIPAIMLIVFGCITFIIAAIGCIGACKESACLLFTFAAIIAVLLIAEIVVGAVAFAFRGKVEELVKEYGPKLIDQANNATKEGKEPPEGVMATWNLVQKKFECCGFNEPGDWHKKPDSCKPGDGSVTYTKGCKEAIINFVKDNVIVVGGVAIGFGVIELLGIIFACCVGCAARKGEYA